MPSHLGGSDRWRRFATAGSPIGRKYPSSFQSIDKEQKFFPMCSILGSKQTFWKLLEMCLKESQPFEMQIFAFYFFKQAVADLQ